MSAQVYEPTSDRRIAHPTIGLDRKNDEQTPSFASWLFWYNDYSQVDLKSRRNSQWRDI
jgi:hypothetical protein